MKTVEELESLIGVSFIDKALLDQARTMPNDSLEEEVIGYKPLELIGDAVLQLCVTIELVGDPRMCADSSTNLRSHWVSNDLLAELATELDIVVYMRANFRDLGSIDRLTGGRPKYLADVIEAIIGAIFTDQGYNAARDFIFAHIVSLARSKNFTPHPKSTLQILVNKRGLGNPVYRLIDSFWHESDCRYTVAVIVHGKSYGEGSGSTRKDAERAAAQQALFRHFRAGS